MEIGMEDSGYRSCHRSESPMCSPAETAHNIFSIKYSDLAASKYSGLLLGFQNEQDFEDFKQDLIDFQKLKKACCGDGVGCYDDSDSLLELEEELQFIRRPNTICKERRKGHVIRRLDQFYQSPGVQAVVDVKSSQTAGVPTRAIVNSQCPENGNSLTDCPEQTPRSGRSGKRNSFDLRPDFDRRSGIFGFDRNCALRSSIHTILMEFLSGDEHFREFERVYETVNSKKDNTNANLHLSSERNNRVNMRSDNQVSSRRDSHQNLSGDATDMFSDFFDNDETFLEFEKEFEKFRSSRRSNMLGSLNSLGSSRDIFGDMKSYCERNIKAKSGSHVSVNSFSSTHDEATPVCGDEAAHPELIWHSVEDWAKMLRKMKRNSRLLLETCCHHKPQYRHSVSVQSRQGLITDAYNKTQSLADLRHCCDNGDLNQSNLYSSPYNRARASQSDADLLQINSLPSTANSQNAHPDGSLDKSFQSINFGSDSEDCSDPWSDNYDNDNRYSSSSTLCSGDGDICSSFSCSCCSDLHVGDDTDDELEADDRSPPLRARSHSLREFSKNTRPDHLGLHSVSVDNLTNCENKNLKWRTNSHYKAPLPKEAYAVSSAPYLDDDTPTDDDEFSNRWSRAPSTVSAQLSDAESEHYHSAASDLSDQYSTAKSDLSQFTRGHDWDCKSRSRSPDLFAVSPPLIIAVINEDHQRSVTRGQYHTYHGREGPAKYKQDRPRPGSACQYTCHQQCLPAVTLNCKSISDDGCEVTTSRTPSPSDPPSHLETSLSVGKPGCARTASANSASSTNIVTSQAAQRSSESVPDFHIVPGENGDVDSVVHSDFIYDYAGTPKVTRLPSRHLSRSSSDGFFAGLAPHTPHTHANSSLTLPSSQRHTSSPHSTLVPANRLSGSAQEAGIQTSTSRQTLLKTAVLNAALDGSVAVSGDVIQGNSSVTSCSDTDSSSSNNNMSHNPESSDDPLVDLPHSDASQEAASEKDETDSGYRSGTIPDDKLPRVPSQATLDRQALSRTIAKYNHFVPAAGLEMTEKESFQGFVKVTMNLIRPITMELGARPPSIYELLTREHIIEENTQQVAFYMPRDTHKSLHITSETTTKEVVTSLLKKFHILDHPRKFAMYEQEFNERNKLVRLRRLTDKDFPLRAVVDWDPERITNYRMVLQENETGEIVWDVFSLPELGNFLKVLDREEKETILELKHKYAYMKQYMERRLVELRHERSKQIQC